MLKNEEMYSVRFEVTEAARYNRVRDRRNVEIKIIDEISFQPTPCQAFLHLPRWPRPILSH